MKKFFKILACIIAVIGIICLGFLVANCVNNEKMNEYIDSFGRVEYENRLEPQYDEDGVPYFTTDTDFKLLHLTDIHISGGVLSAKKDKMALNAVAAMVAAEKPDLVIITGDIAFAVPWSGTLNNKYAHSYFSRLMENLGVYWTITLGNHDSEAYNFYNRAAVAKMYEDDSLKGCLFTKGPDDVFGECNHIINVKNSLGLITKSLIMLDSNSYTDDDPLGLAWNYDNIHDDQISWYESSIEKYNSYNKTLFDSLDEAVKPTDTESFLTVQSLLFMHIPLKEVKVAYNEFVNNNRQSTPEVSYIRGNDGETGKVVYSSENDDEMFETITRLGSTKALFYGHDHLNNFVLEYNDVILSYGYSIDYNAYSGIHKKGYQRGCTVIVCSPDTSFEITHENYYQDKYLSLYEKETVDMAK